MLHVLTDFPDLSSLNLHDVVEINQNNKSHLYYYGGKELEAIKLPKMKVRGLFTEHHAFQYLFIQHPEISIINLIGVGGGGKSYMALGCALEAIREQELYNKIMIVRELCPSSKWKAGYLPGNYETKTRMAFDAITDAMEALGTKSKLFTNDPNIMIDELITNQTIEFTTLEYFRGRNLANCVIVADDCQNLSVDNIRLLVTRMGDNSRLILTGDPSQVDDSKLDELGMEYLNRVMSGSRFYTQLEFVHPECRSPLVKEFLMREKKLLEGEIRP